MEFIIESSNINDYLREVNGLIDYNHPSIQKKIQEIKVNASTSEERARLAFDFVRDYVNHSFDTNSYIISTSASETIENKEGICFAKSHLLAALLRGMGIPTGFCYQRVCRKGTVESGYALHGLNAVYLSAETGWFRVDPRGNKEGISSAFNIADEKLAYTIHKDLGEEDYPYILVNPYKPVLQSMEDSNDCQELFFKRPETFTR